MLRSKTCLLICLMLVTASYNKAATTVISVTPSASICPGTSAILTASGAEAYTWSPAVGLSSVTGPSVIATPTTHTTYTVIGTSADGSADTATCVVNVCGYTPVNSIFLYPDTICKGDNVFFSAPGLVQGPCGWSRSWLSPVTLVWTSQWGGRISPLPTATTTYSLSHYDNTCPDVRDTTFMTITVIDPPTVIVTGNTDTICKGGRVHLTASGGADSYRWQPASGLSNTTGTITTASPSSTTTYTIVGSTGNGKCSDYNTITVTVNTNIVTTVSDNIKINCGESTVLSAVEAESYSWNPAVGLSCLTCRSPLASPGETTTYCVTSADEYNCLKQDYVTVDVAESGTVFVPTAFSPNGDGYNDFVCVIPSGCVESFALLIFDRWGTKVFDSNNSSCWDGTYKNQRLNTGVFTYTLYATLTSGKELFIPGNISLLK